MHHLDLFLAALLQSLAQSAPYILIGYLLAAVIREWVPLSTMARLFADRGLRPVGAAVGLGSLLPMCSCTVIPVGVGLVRGGAARGTILAFLVAAPAISPVAVGLCLALLGPVFAALYAGTVLLGAVVLGLVGNRVLRSGPPTEPATACVVEPPRSARPWPRRLGSAVRWAFWDLGAEISVDLVIGLSIAAAVLALLPMGLIGQWLGEQRFATLIYVILIGIPMYTCTVPSMPVVQSLLLAGMSPGAGIAYLIAGPATNLGELLVLRRQFGPRATGLFAGGLALMALAGGLVADHMVFAGYRYTPAPLGATAPGCCVSSFMPATSHPVGVAEAAAAVPLWAWPFTALLVLVLAVGIVRRVRRWTVGDAIAHGLPAGAGA